MTNNRINKYISFSILYILYQFLTIQTEIIVRFHLQNGSIRKVEESDRKFIGKKSFLNFCSKFLTEKKESNFKKKNDGLEIDIDLSKIYYSEFMAFHLYLKSLYFPNNLISFEEFVRFLVVLEELKVDFDAGFIKLIDTILFNLYNLFESSKYYLKDTKIDSNSLIDLNIYLYDVEFVRILFKNKYIYSNIKILEISNSNMAYNSLKFLLLFPNLKKLKMTNNNILYSEVNKIFETNMSIVSFEFEGIQMPSLKNFLQFIKSMKNLKNLSIKYQFGRNTLAFSEIEEFFRSEIDYFSFISCEDIHMGVFLLSAFSVKHNIELTSSCELGNLKANFSYDGFKNIRSIKISSIKIDETAINVFENLRRLERIELRPSEHLPIHFYKFFSSSCIYNLKVVILRGMKIVNIDIIFFSKSKNLEILEFNECHFNNISYIYFAKTNFIYLKLLKFLSYDCRFSKDFYDFLNEEYSENILHFEMNEIYY
ncbi:hypothetical protein CWI39_0511p0010 [Hamiltosporidium magnivora]|uniref:Uncharacterized protein n=1 Tax=Hamiltosporidium magnivora TaxID=148818 RepID=A0A4Q9LFD1_9MICR|nr:hypothetical protein CWI39_0511p0010 [Hamiltosporidium magnivora]